MAGQAADQEGFFLSVALDILKRSDIEITPDAESQIRAFLRPGLERMATMRYSEIERVQVLFRNRMSKAAIPGLSIREILQRLCPCNPFC